MKIFGSVPFDHSSADYSLQSQAAQDLGFPTRRFLDISSRALALVAPTALLVLHAHTSPGCPTNAIVTSVSAGVPEGASQEAGLKGRMDLKDQRRAEDWEEKLVDRRDLSPHCEIKVSLVGF